MRCIGDIKNENEKMNEENDYSILAQCKIRNEILREASKDVPFYDFSSNIPVVNREHEIACIVKCILPKGMRPSLMSSTLS